MSDSAVQEPGISAAHESRNVSTSDAQSLENSEFLEPLRKATERDRSLVEAAMDTVIARYLVIPSDAIDLLREAGHYLGRPLLKVAIDVIAEGRLPEEAMIRARREQCAERRLSQADSPTTSLLNDRLTRPVDRVLGASWTLGGIHEAPQRVRFVRKSARHRPSSTGQSGG